MKRYKYITSLGLLCFTLFVGCVSNPEMGHEFKSENISKIKVGQTTEQQVIELIGHPDNRTRSSDGTVVLAYSHMKPGKQYMTMADVFNPNNNARVNYSMKSLTVMIGTDGKVTNFTESGD